MAKLLLRFFIHLENSDIKFSPNGPLFHRYLPDGKNDEIVMDTGDPNFILKVWFERRGFVQNGAIEFDYRRKEVDPEIIPRQAILDGGPLSCLLEINEISSEQEDVIRNEKKGDPIFVKLGKEIVKKIQPSINNLLSIIRIKYGQYWIATLGPFDSRYSSIGGYFSSLQTESSLDNGANWVKFLPDHPTHIGYSTIGGNYKYYFSKDDWTAVKSMANEKFEPSVAMNCLIQAHQYMDQGDLKHAIIEGVTALELSIEEFFEKKLTGKDVLMNKFGEFKQLHLPTKTTMVSTAIGIAINELEDALSIIGIRNNIAHDGISPEERDVERKLFSTLNIVSTLIYDKKYRFPEANHGNEIKSIEQWGRNENV